MSELKVNTIKPAAGSQVTVTAQVLGVPGTEPNHLATVSQLGGGGSSGISRAEAQALVDTGVASANLHSDDKDEEQNTQIALDIATTKTEAIATSKTYTDSEISKLNLSGGLLQRVSNNTVVLRTDAGHTTTNVSFDNPPTYVQVVVTPKRDTGTKMFINVAGHITRNTTDNGGTQRNGQILRSIDGGTTWEQILLNGEGPAFLVLHQDPSEAQNNSFGNGVNLMGFDEEYYTGGGLQGRTGTLDGNVRYRFEWDSFGSGEDARTFYLSITVDELSFI